MQNQPALNWKDFLGQPDLDQCKHHTVQFYETESFLAEALSHFIASGIQHGEAVIIVATAEHEASFKRELALAGFSYDAPIASGQLLFLDAHATLETLMVAGAPDPERFRKSVGGLLESTLARFPRLRAYGEMVDILRAQGNLEAMIALEELWNELATIHDFSLLCGYSIKGFSREDSKTAFEDVCRTHTHVLPAETFSALLDSSTLR